MNFNTPPATDVVCGGNITTIEEKRGRESAIQEDRLRKWVLQTVFGDFTGKTCSVSSVLQERLVSREYKSSLRVCVGLVDMVDRDLKTKSWRSGISRSLFEFWFEGEDRRFLVSSLPFSPPSSLPPCPPFVESAEEGKDFDLSFGFEKKKEKSAAVLSPRELQEESIEGMNMELSVLIPLSLKCCAEWIGHCCSNLVLFSIFSSRFCFSLSPPHPPLPPPTVVLGWVKSTGCHTKLSI